MRLILVFGLICQSSFIYCRSVKNEENPGQKLAQLLLPLLDDALEQSGNDASLLEVHPYNDGSRSRKKVELTPLNAKAKKEPKPLAIILTSNLADLKKQKERKLRNGVVNEVPFDGSGDSSREHRIRSNKIHARGSLSKIYMNEKTNKLINQSPKKYKVPNYKIKFNKKSYYDKTVEKTNEIISDEIDKKKQQNQYKLQKYDFHYIDKNIKNDLKAQKKTMEDDVQESDSIVSESDEFEYDSNSEILVEKSVSDGTGSVNSRETVEKQTNKINKHPIMLQDISNEEINQIYHIQKKSDAELSNETKQVKETKEVDSHEKVELVSAEIAQDDPTIILKGSGADVLKHVTSRVRDHSDDNEINKTKESDKTAENHHTSDKTQELIKDQYLSKSELRGTVSSESIEENKTFTEEFTEKVIYKEKNIEKSESSLENQSKKFVNELLTAEETHEYASQLHDVYDVDVTIGLTEEEQTSHDKYSEEYQSNRSKEIEHVKNISKEVIHNNIVFSGETKEIDSNNFSLTEEKHSDTVKLHSSKALDEKSERKINHIVKSISEEEISEKAVHSKHDKNSQQTKSIESVVSSSKESIKRSKNVNKALKINESNIEYSKEVKDDVDKKHWVRYRGKPAKIAKKRIIKKPDTGKSAHDIYEHTSLEQTYSHGSTSEHYKEKSDSLTDRNSSQEHNNSNVLEHNKERSRCHKKHKSEVKIFRRQNTEDEDEESDTRNNSKSSNQNSNQNAKVQKSYNLSFKFDKK